MTTRPSPLPLRTLWSRRALVGLGLVSLALVACEDQPDPQFRDGTLLDEVTFTPTDVEMGIFPNESVMFDPNNPFRLGTISTEGKFIIETEGNNAAKFYGWATVLARQPTGEHQYYTATSLAGLFENREVDNRSLELVRDMAIRAFLSVLDNFPDSVTFEESGTFSFPLAPLAYQGIVNLGGIPPANWVAIENADGTTTVVRID